MRSAIVLGGLEEIEFWEKRFAQLVEHAQELHNLNPGAASPLSGWVAEQRQLAARGQLLEARRHRLEKLGLLFKFDELLLAKQTWELHYEALRSRIQTHKGFVPSLSGKTKIEKWLNVQHKKYKSKKLPSELLARLRDICPSLFGTPVDARHNCRNDQTVAM